MPVDQQPHGIASYVKKINNEYQNEYNTTNEIIQFNSNDALIGVDNSKVTHWNMKFAETGNRFDINANIDYPFGMDEAYNNSNNTQELYLMNRSDNKLMWYTLDQPYHANSASVNNQFLYPDSHTNYGGSDTQGCYISDNGNNFHFALGNDIAIAHYSASTSFDLTTLTQESITDYSSYGIENIKDIAFEQTGSEVFILDLATKKIFHIDLATNFDTSTPQSIIAEFDFSHIPKSQSEIQFATPENLIINDQGQAHLIELDSVYDLSNTKYNKYADAIVGSDNRPETIQKGAVTNPSLNTNLVMVERPNGYFLETFKLRPSMHRN